VVLYRDKEEKNIMYKIKGRRPNKLVASAVEIILENTLLKEKWN
jgi:hypothetical protein